MINILTLYLIFITVLGIFWTVQIRTLNGSNYARVILLLSIAVCFFIFGYAMELNSTSKLQIAFWNRIEYIGIPYVSALWLTVALMYTGYSTRYKKILFAAIYVIPIITMVLRLTNEYHYLYFASMSYVEKYEKVFLVRQYGPWMYVQMFHSMFMILAAMGLFVYDSIKSEEKQLGKILLTIAASFFAVSGLILSLVKPFGLPIDFMAMCLPITCILVILAISRYDLLEIKSIARNRAFEAGSDAILLINRQHKVLDYNHSAKQLFERINVHLEDRYLTTLFNKFPDLLEGIKSTEVSFITLSINGENRYYDITTQNIDSNSITRGWIKTIRDVTPIYQLNEELKKQAMTDVLSTLYNRRAFIQIGQERIEECNENGNTLYLLMMDMDHFKNVNDQYGHAAGDQVIRDFGQILKTHFDTDSLIARLGGEEFAVLHSGISEEEMINSLNILLNSIEQHIYYYRNYKFHVTISAGVVKRHLDQTLESMMRKADKALYQSKDRGRNCITVL